MTRHAIYWWETEPVKPGRRVDGDLSVDVCIVGGGFTGMWTALFLARADPSLEIAVVEADWAGCGASSHNDGFAGTQLERGLHHLVERLGRERAAALHQSLARSAREIGDFCGEHAIDADYERAGYLTIATDDGQRWRHRLASVSGRPGAESSNGTLTRPCYPTDAGVPSGSLPTPAADEERDLCQP